MYKQKRSFAFLLCIACLVMVASPVSANTVEFRLEKLGDLEISGFQLFFFEPDGSYEYPVDINVDTLESDFSADWGPAQNNSDLWSLESFIEMTESIDYARGVGGVANLFNPSLKLDEGLILSLTSENSFFGIDIENPAMAFFDFNGTDGENITSQLIFESEWDGNTQIVTANNVPIPSALLLLGSGIAGLVGIRRKMRT